jgi:hypothetical protein
MHACDETLEIPVGRDVARPGPDARAAAGRGAALGAHGRHPEAA